jgi:hypothetical protein
MRTTPRNDKERRPEMERRSERRNDDSPAWRPDNEVPSNRRDDQQRHDHDDEQEQRDRRGS